MFVLLFIPSLHTLDIQYHILIQNSSQTLTTSHLVNSFSIFSTHIFNNEALFQDFNKSEIIVLTNIFHFGTAHAFNHFLIEATFFSHKDLNKVHGFLLFQILSIFQFIFPFAKYIFIHKSITNLAVLSLLSIHHFQKVDLFFETIKKISSSMLFISFSKFQDGKLSYNQSMFDNIINLLDQTIADIKADNSSLSEKSNSS
ncbi:hypothetical protein HOA93_03205 [bacterium]|nr:hypothetical protein [bacterium]MBT6778775.1 hypothetical protein [bacterium]